MLILPLPRNGQAVSFLGHIDDKKTSGIVLAGPHVAFSFRLVENLVVATNGLGETRG